MQCSCHVMGPNLYACASLYSSYVAAHFMCFPTVHPAISPSEPATVAATVWPCCSYNSTSAQQLASIACNAPGALWFNTTAVC